MSQSRPAAVETARDAAPALELSDYREIFAQAPVALAVLSGSEHRFQSSNALYRRLVGRNPDGKTLAEAFPELEGQGIRELLDGVLRSGEPFVGEEVLLKLDRDGTGTPRESYFNFIYQPRRGPGGAVTGVAVVAYDVTDQVLARLQTDKLVAEGALIREHLNLRAAYLSLGTEVGQILAKTKSSDQMLQKSAEALHRHLGAAFARIWTLNEATQVLEMRASAGMYTHKDGPHGRVPVGKFKIGRIAESREPHLSNDVINDPHVGDHEWARREGMVSFAGYPLLVEGRVLGVVALFARRPMEREMFEAVAALADMVAMGVQRKFDEEAMGNLIGALEKSNEQLGRSNQELDQFAYVASHDLKAPLRGIGNLSDWIEEDLGENVPQGVREKMKLLRGRVHRMEALIDGILDYSRAGRVRHKPEQVDVGRLLKEVLELLAPPAGVAVFVEPRMPVLDTERVPLQQVFLNLVSNAIKHARSEHPRIEVLVRPEGAFHRFTIKDNGPGIAPEFQERIWGIFQTLEARDKVEGTGIGLSVVKKIVESRGCKAWVESVAGEGAAFHFTWPKREAANGAAQ